MRAAKVSEKESVEKGQGGLLKNAALVGVLVTSALVYLHNA